MGKREDYKYYDKIYSSTSNNYSIGWEGSVYLPLWEHLMGVWDFRGRLVRDLGCGVGQFACFLRDKIGRFHYVGYDFSRVAIERASKACPSFTFKCVDLETYDIGKDCDHEVTAYAVVMLEVLEHCYDLAVLSWLPVGAEVYCTLPDFDDPAHERHFKDEESVRKRYGHIIDIKDLHKFDRWWVMRGVMREVMFVD